MSERKIIDLGRFNFIPAVINFLKIPTRMDSCYSSNVNLHGGGLSDNVLVDVDSDRIHFVTTDTHRISVVTIEGDYKDKIGKYVFSTNEFFRGFFKGWEKKENKKTFVYDVVFCEDTTRVEAKYPRWRPIIDDSNKDNLVEDIVISYSGYHENNYAVRFNHPRAFNSKYIFDFVKVVENLYHGHNPGKLIGRVDKLETCGVHLMNPVYFKFDLAEFAMDHVIMPVQED